MLGYKTAKNLLYVTISGFLVIVSVFFIINFLTPGKTPVSRLAVEISNSLPAATATSAITIMPTPTNVTAPNTLAAGKTPLEANSKLQQTWLAGVPATVYIPEKIKRSQDTQLVIALHGMQGKGEAICKGLISFAEQNGVILLAPTFNYNPNWQDPQIVASEDPALATQLNQMVGELKIATNLQFNNHLLLYGFSRGAQLAHRYALLYPDKTLGVATLSAGSYTLPYKNDASKSTQPLPFPFGVSDLKNYTGKPFNQKSFAKVNFLIEVGAMDNDPEQTPPAWDSYLGRSRLERAESFYLALKEEGVAAQITIFPDTAHQETLAMRTNALNFFKGLITS
ncbi:MAG: hypothetical protein WCS37_03550 [Chloroflexota bacterium]|nr:alpha/beta hydrolase [Chloroflexota bacterium]